jgi:translation initiation factor 2B subunit (eIF-2B alpha/beta/delta family)
MYVAVHCTSRKVEDYFNTWKKKGKKIKVFTSVFLSCSLQPNTQE